MKSNKHKLIQWSFNGLSSIVTSFTYDGQHTDAKRVAYWLVLHLNFKRQLYHQWSNIKGRLCLIETGDRNYIGHVVKPFQNLYIFYTLDSHPLYESLMLPINLTDFEKIFIVLLIVLLVVFTDGFEGNPIGTS